MNTDNQSNTNSLKLLIAINEISNLLLKSFDIKSGVDMNEIMPEVLKSLGNMGRADRCYIWENYTFNGQILMKQIYEWVNEGNKIEALQDTEVIDFVPYDPITYDLLSAGKTINSIVKDLDEYNRSVLEPQNIKSILIIPIYIEEYFWGFIGFDNCHSEELWSSLEEKTLMMVGFMLTSVLEYDRSKKRS